MWTSFQHVQEQWKLQPSTVGLTRFGLTVRAHSEEIVFAALCWRQRGMIRYYFSRPSTRWQSGVATERQTFLLTASKCMITHIYLYIMSVEYKSPLWEVVHLPFTCIWVGTLRCSSLLFHSITWSGWRKWTAVHSFLVEDCAKGCQGLMVAFGVHMTSLYSC